MQPTIPKHLNQYALACLEALQQSGLGQHISLGGALGLAHYHEYRTTKDVDAWWNQDTTEKDEKRVISLLEKTLARFGEVRIREFGDVLSLDLVHESQVVFNFQIARRSVQLRPSLPSSWAPVKLDSFEDLLASKMTALLQRGIPRDFLDIFEICHRGLGTSQRCWDLWREREKKRGVEQPDVRLAVKALLVHLSRIERMRPLESIKNLESRRKAQALREWFKNEFCQGKI
ncbi:MAG: nucleotidyl transferase AbiEii/AbiGii toxin family protein [bacterium]